MRAFRSRPHHRLTVTATALAGAMILSAATAVAAAGQFGDVAPDHPHASGISWLVDQEVTAGCGDGSDYCPSDDVNRAQMATFLHRLSGHAPGIAPSIDAATVQGLDPADLVGDPGPEGPQGPQGPTGETGPQGPAGEDATTLWVRVSSEGDVLASSTTDATVTQGSFDGSWTVGFGESMTACAAQGTISTDPPPSGILNGTIVVIHRNNNIGVVTRDGEGNTALRPFVVTVTC